MSHTESHHSGAASVTFFKAMLAGIMTVAVAAASPAAAATEPASQDPVTKAVTVGVPTTKLMAIGTRTANGTPEAVRQLLPAEIRETVQLYLAGKLDQWFVKQDQTGVIFILNVTDPEQARVMLRQLPLGRAGLMEFQFIPLGPLSPLGLLLTPPGN
jgi:hypothetical protein